MLGKLNHHHQVLDIHLGLRHGAKEPQHVDVAAKRLDPSKLVGLGGKVFAQLVLLLHLCVRVVQCRQLDHFNSHRELIAKALSKDPFVDLAVVPHAQNHVLLEHDVGKAQLKLVVGVVFLGFARRGWGCCC